MITKKKCEVESCNGFVWKEGRCKQHLPSTPLKKKGNPIKKFSEKGLARKKEKTQRTKELHEFMFNWWQNLSSRDKQNCWSCGARMPSDFSTAHCDHLLEKGTDKYRHLAFEPQNLWYCCLTCHQSKGNGFPTEKHKAAIEKAKEVLIFDVIKN